MTPPPSDTALRCPLCRATTRLWTRRDDRVLRCCTQCRFAWVPQGLARTDAGVSIYEDETPFFMTPAYADYYRDESAIDAARMKVAWVAAYVTPGSRVLDVGANVGFFVRHASERFHATGVEPSAAAVAWGRAHLDADLQVGSIDVDDAAFVGRCDAVTMFDVIEHLEDPRAALARCRNYLTPGGHLFITTPDSGSLVARLLGSRWYYIDVIQHLALFSVANLSRLLTESGFEVISTRTVGRRYRFSYIARRLDELSAGNAVLRIAAVAAAPLRLWPRARVPLNFGDVMGVVARRTG
jgi:SAM-dependent methyltransferase